MAGRSVGDKCGRPAAAVLLATSLLACAPSEPVRVGFLGGLSGRVADLGIGGRNGAMLAVETRNQAGGIKGRPVELVSEDDQQDEAIARQAVGRLIGRKVAAIVGPMTSAMAVATVPLVDAAHLLMISPTVTTTALSGRDDQFLRVVASTTEYARRSADYHYREQGSRRIAAAFDTRNRAYTESWLHDYRTAFQAAGGQVLAATGFQSSDETQFAVLAEQLLQQRPDGVLILANSVDAALLAQQLRRRDPAIRIYTSEWAATERLIELGGKAVEGVVIAQFLDRDSRAPAYVAFRRAYRERFAQEPGFAGLTAYDATNVVLDALAAQASGENLKAVVLGRQTFAGVQSEIRFDAYGDAFRETYLTTIRNGSFVRLH